MAQCAHKLNELRSVFRGWWCLRRLLQSVLGECSRSEHCVALQRTIKFNIDFDRVPGRRPKTTAHSTFSSKNPLKSNAAAWQMTNMFVHRITTMKTLDYNWTINAFKATKKHSYLLTRNVVFFFLPMKNCMQTCTKQFFGRWAWVWLNSFRYSFPINYLILYSVMHLLTKAHHT